MCLQVNSTVHKLHTHTHTQKKLDSKTFFTFQQDNTTPIEKDDQDIKYPAKPVFFKKIMRISKHVRGQAPNKI